MLQYLGVPPVPSLRAVGACCWVGVPPPLSPPRQPLALGARDRLGGSLSSVSPMSGFRAELTPLGFSSPSSSWVHPALWFVAPCPSAPAAGPTIAGPLSDASNATLSHWRRGCLLFSVVALSALSKCSGGCPAPPSTVAISIASSGASVLLGCAAPLPSSGPFPLLAQAVGGFSSPPPRPHPSSPCQYWDAVRDPRVSSPLVPSASLGVELS